MAEAGENQPLNRDGKDMKEVSLRFPEGSVGPQSKSTGKAFEGYDKPPQSFRFLTQREDYELPIPEPPKSQIEEAESKGLDPTTGLAAQPQWLSVLKKRQAPPVWIRVPLFNCFCNPRLTLTRAQWIWFNALICLVLYTYYGIVALQESLKEGKGVSMEATIWRIQPVWNATLQDGYTAVLVDNQRPIRVDLIIVALFGVSVFWQLFEITLGPFDQWIWIYWRQLDLCFHWWRYVDLLVTFPIMSMAVCLLVQLREENAIALIVISMFTTVAGFLLTELWSRPHRNADASYDMTRWLGDEAPIKPGIPASRLSSEELYQRSLQQSRRRMNYVIRMIPSTLSIFPFVASWVVMLNAFFTSLYDLRVETGDNILNRLPSFVPITIIGTLVLQTLFFLPLWWWQWGQPQFYWQTSIVYSLLSLGTKLFLGIMFLDNVINKGSYNLALALDQNMTAVA